MARVIPSLCLTAALFGGPPVAAQPPPAPPNIGPPDVRVQLMPGTPRKIRIGPRGVGVCKNPSVCANHFTVMWVGMKNTGEKIRIEFTTPGASDCFDNVSFTIDGIGAGFEKTVTALPPRMDCPKKGFFFFEVSCIDAAGGNCGGVAPVDPGAMVDGGRGG